MKRILVLIVAIILPLSTHSKITERFNLITHYRFPDFIQYSNKRTKREYARKITSHIFKNAARYGHDPITLLALMKVESEFIRTAKSKAGAIGLMQVLPKVWVYNKENEQNLITKKIIKHKKQLYWTKKNIQAGSFILKEIRKTCQRWKKRKTLIGRGFRSINECMIKRYNGKEGNSYYEKVTSTIGDYYYFTQRR